MKSIVSVLSVVLLVSLAPAQVKLPAATESHKQDTVQQMQERNALSMSSHEKRFFNGPGFHFGQRMMSPGSCGPGCAEMRGENRFQNGPHFMNQHRHFRMLRLFKLLFLGMAVLNILLAIIVSLDMARAGRFNGLWIPVVLIAGIPGSIIYALFRIGDRIQAKNAS